jgi:hypothetical protein
MKVSAATMFLIGLVSTSVAAFTTVPAATATAALHHQQQQQQQQQNQQRKQGESKVLLSAMKDLKTMTGATMPWKGFDPLGLASLGSESTYAWFRASELKHARCAMLATTGYLVQAAGIHFPGMLSHDVSFESLSTMKPLDAWAAMPSLGQQQIIGK